MDRYIISRGNKEKQIQTLIWIAQICDSIKKYTSYQVVFEFKDVTYHANDEGFLSRLLWVLQQNASIKYNYSNDININQRNKINTVCQTFISQNRFLGLYMYSSVYCKNKKCKMNYFQSVYECSYQQFEDCINKKCSYKRYKKKRKWYKCKRCKVLPEIRLEQRRSRTCVQ